MVKEVGKDSGNRKGRLRRAGEGGCEGQERGRYFINDIVILDTVFQYLRKYNQLDYVFLTNAILK